jgi:hypothetical protein
MHAMMLAFLASCGLAACGTVGGSGGAIPSQSGTNGNSTGSGSGTPTPPSVTPWPSQSPSPSGSASPSSAPTSTPTPNRTPVPTPTPSGTPAPSPTSSTISVPVPIPGTPTPPASPPQLGQAFFPNGNGSGNCANGLTLTYSSNANQNGVADVSITEPGYNGTFSVSSNTNSSVASASISNSILTVSALSGGTAGHSTTISVSDSYGNTSACKVTVN